MPRLGRPAKVGGALTALTAGAGGGAWLGSLFGPLAPVAIPLFASLGAGAATTAFLLSGVSADEQQNIIEAAQQLEVLKKRKKLTPRQVQQQNKLLKKFPILKNESATIAQNAYKLTPQVKQQMADLNRQLQANPALAQNVNNIRNSALQSGDVSQLQRAINESQSTNGGIKGNAWEGYPAQQLRFEKFTPEQQAGMSQVLQTALSGLGKNQFDFAPIEQQAREGFEQKTIPTIAERFTQANAQRSSAFPQILGQAGKDLETELAAMKQNYGLTQQQALHNLLGIGLTPQFGSVFYAGQPGQRAQLLNTAAQFATPENIGRGIDLLRQGAQGVGNWWQNRTNQNQMTPGLTAQNTMTQGLAPIDTTYNPLAAQTAQFPGLRNTLNLVTNPTGANPSMLI